MSPELTDKIIAKCPSVFSKINHIEAPDGWFTLIEGVCILIEQFNKTHNPTIAASQIKEKFGGLRFYTTTSDPYVDGIIHMAEVLASHTCQLCGKTGKPANIKGWYAALCEQHIQEKENV